MIHQCYFLPDQLSLVFRGEPYSPFGLEPRVNAEITKNCPELESADTRMALAEYGAMLHLWRNPELDTDNWIGFTSYRQLTKSAVEFQSKHQVDTLLARGDYVSWYLWWLGDFKHDGLTGAAAQGEANHPGLHAFIVDMLGAFSIDVPATYSSAPFAPFANYWVMSKVMFGRYMDWSWPIIGHALTAKHPYISESSELGSRDNKSRAIGYFMERLFILWSQIERLRTVVVGPLYDYTGRAIESQRLTRLMKGVTTV